MADQPKGCWPRDFHGKLSAHSTVGGYPLRYIDGDANTICAQCAHKSLDSEYESDRPVTCDVNWETEGMECNDCGAEIDCAYPSDRTIENWEG